MNLSLAFSHSIAGYFWLTALVMVLLKLTSTVVQITLMRGDYRRSPDTSFFRMVYLTGKITPTLAAVCTCIAAVVQHNRTGSWFYGVLAVLAALLAVWVVRLRKQGRFFGLLDMVSKKQD